MDEVGWNNKIRDVLKIFSQLDGYNVMLKMSEPLPQDQKLKTRKGWYAPVRVWNKDEEWENEDHAIKGSHDENGNIRLEYVTEKTNSETGEITDLNALDIDCIEANDFNISAGRYKPFDLKMDDIDPPEELIKSISDPGK